MTMNLDDQKKDGSDDKETRYPLEKYIKQIPSVELSVDFSTLGKFPLSEEDLMKLQEIKTLVKSAEEEINILASKSFKQEGEVFHIEQPSYFDDNFDQEKYVRDLVNAKFQGMKIIEHENAATKVQKIIMLKKAIDKMNDEDSESSDTITMHKVPKAYQVKIQNNKTHATRDVEQNVEQESRAADNFVKVTSHEVVQIDEKRSEERFNKISRSNHKIIEIKSIETEDKNNMLQRQLTLTKIPGLSVEVMPSINIRSQLIEQKIPSLDIFPTDKNNTQPNKANNIALVNTEHQDAVREIKYVEPEKKVKHSNVQVTSIITQEGNVVGGETLQDDKIIPLKSHQVYSATERKSKQVVSKPNKVKDPSDQSYLFLNRNLSEPVISETLNKKISKLKKYGIPEIQQIYNPKTQIYKRCPTIYTRPATSTNKYLSNISKQPVFLRRDVPKYGNDRTMPSTSYMRPKTESDYYIPYSKLTIGGYKADEVERIVKSKSSKSQSFVPNIETNQNYEYLEDESEKSSTKNDSVSECDSNEESQKSQASNDHSFEKYMDDFDIECKSDNSDEKPPVEHTLQDKKQKIASLGFKSKVDVYDFVNYVETKDDSTQSSPVKSISYRETQTSPEQQNDVNQQSRTRTQHKDLSSIDASNITLADMLQIQKVLSTLNSLSNNLNQEESERVKQAESRDDNSEKVLQIPSSIQKDTQTSPLRNKHVMTSPAKMVAQISSPVFDDVKIDAETSPWDYESRDNEDEIQSRHKVAIDFSNVLPGTSRQNIATLSSPKKSIVRDSTDVCTDVSHSESSESHSLGEINLSILRKKSFVIKKHHNKSNSTSTSLGMSSSSDVQLDSSNYYIPKKSDGEISEGQILKNI